MKRREFITLLGGAAVPSLLWPLAARAQQPTLPIVGFLASTSPDPVYAPIVAAVREGLKETGYVEGRNLAIEYRWAEGKYERLPALAAELLDRRVSVIVANTPAALAAKAATTTIPIVFGSGLDPVKAGLVASLNRPGGNITGVSSMSGELVSKQLELLHELVRSATVIGALVNPANPGLAESLSKELQAAADSLGLQLRVLPASSEREIDAASATLMNLQADALVIGADGFFSARSEKLAAMALRHAVPAISPYRPFVEAGGLMRYGTNTTDGFRLAGNYAGRILKGEKPADLPVMQSVKFEFAINLKTARALGLEIPPSLLARADEVIE
jgi:putative tryptophan/tyrosine transport system substrate-binding protein